MFVINMARKHNCDYFSSAVDYCTIMTKINVLRAACLIALGRRKPQFYGNGLEQQSQYITYGSWCRSCCRVLLIFFQASLTMETWVWDQAFISFSQSSEAQCLTSITHHPFIQRDLSGKSKHLFSMKGPSTNNVFCVPTTSVTCILRKLTHGERG